MTHTAPGTRQADLRDEICRVGRSLYARGYVHASAGNISARLTEEQGGGALITPTDACLGELEPERLAWVDAQGQQRGGDRASKTLALHRAIYDADPAARCVIHTHSTHLVAATLREPWRPDCLLPPITPYFVMKVGRVPLVPYHRPGDPAVAVQVSAFIRDAAARGAPLRAVMLDRLGPNVWHETPAAAMAVLEELEETAKLWVLSGGKVEALNEAAIDELRRSFDARW